MDTKAPCTAAAMCPGEIFGVILVYVDDFLIIAIDGVEVDSVSSLLARLDQLDIGDRVTVRIWRDGIEQTVGVVLQGSAI